ncbi:hypothetical protein HNY73_021978 [Argiope bruennichi]|uniref:Uncharacterized protein n=1 Tax=Argiope bruennichi TaxID=94029 RepID=A0A8T0E068_ARGBR|nr:hypothetical protein HNY73_021978 [Argiope bruennichi]
MEGIAEGVGIPPAAMETQPQCRMPLHRLSSLKKSRRSMLPQTTVLFVPSTDTLEIGKDTESTDDKKNQKFFTLFHLLFLLLPRVGRCREWELKLEGGSSADCQEIRHTRLVNLVRGSVQTGEVLY